MTAPLKAKLGETPSIPRAEFALDSQSLEQGDSL